MGKLMGVGKDVTFEHIMFGMSLQLPSEHVELLMARWVCSPEKSVGFQKDVWAFPVSRENLKPLGEMWSHPGWEHREGATEGEGKGEGERERERGRGRERERERAPKGPSQDELYIQRSMNQQRNRKNSQWEKRGPREMLCHQEVFREGQSG